MKRMIAAMLLFATPVYAHAAACWENYEYGDLHFSSGSASPLLEGTEAFMTVSSDYIPAGSIIGFDWTHSTGTVQQVRQLNSYRYATSRGLIAPRGEWTVYAYYNDINPAYFGATCHYITVQQAPYTDSISVAGTMRAKEKVTFSGAGYIDDDYSTYGKQGKAGSFRWDFGDGQTATGKTVDYVYATHGSYTVKLQVYDGKYWSNVTQKTVNISPALDYVSPPEITHIEFSGCYGTTPRYTLIWGPGEYGNADRYDLDGKLGTSTWYNLYSGSSTSYSYNAVSGRQEYIRLRAGNGSNWSSFTQKSFIAASCGGGGGWDKVE